MAASNGKINSMEAAPADLIITRVFDAPRELVWKAWTDPKSVSQWWGPKGFTNPRCDWDPRPKGSIHIDMRAPDGVVYPMSGTFQEVVEPERLVFASSALDENGKSMFDILNTVLFVDQKGKTFVTLTAHVISATELAPQYLKGMEMGWQQSLDRLGEHLARSGAANSVATLAGEREIVCTRVFDAPRDLVWQMFTDPSHIPHWWGPKGFTTTVQQMDVRPGGEWRLIMRGPDGRDYHNRIIYREVERPARLVFENSTEKGSEPVSFVTRVDFADASGKTRVDFRMTFSTGTARDQVAKTYGAVEGLTQTLGRLAEHIEKTSASH
ncbi:MAG: SRPBCC domain-containing protein [Candidatus Sulfotelmatobacter sp.]